MNLFSSTAMAAGYAASRPSVHPRVLDRILAKSYSRNFNLILDLGCGSGASTRAAAVHGRFTAAIDPNHSMLRSAPAVGGYAAALAESLPFPDATFDLVTAAGSLNYTQDLRQSLRECARVLAPNGLLAVYDFSPGRRLAGGDPALDHWFDREFLARYPKAKDNAKPLDPATLAAAAEPEFHLAAQDRFAIPLALEHEFYVRYMMTETNVAYAVANAKQDPGAIREWISASLAPIFAGQPRDVVFDGYAVLLAVGSMNPF